MFRPFNAGTCCGLSLRTGLLIVMLLVFGLALSDFTWRWHIHFHENITLQPLLKPLMFDHAPRILYTLVVCDLILAGALIVTAPGKAKAQLGMACFISLVLTCIWWIYVGVHMSTRLRDFRRQYGFSGALTKAQDSNTRVGKMLRGKSRGTLLHSAAFLADQTVAGMMSTTLPEPLGELVWLSWNPGIVIIIFGLIPATAIGSTLIFVGSYVNVVSKGGDGTECLDGKQIENFYDALPEEENLEKSNNS